MEGDQHGEDVGSGRDVGHGGRLPRPSWRRLALGSLSLAAAVAALTILPSQAGTSWSSVRSLVLATTPVELLVLALLWIAGLWCYTFTLTGSLRGLSHRRAILLNLTGSAVSNVLPAGGVFGVWLNTSMLRRWRFPVRRVVDFTVVSNLVDVAGKLVLGAGALAVASIFGRLAPQVVTGATVAVAFVLLLGALGAALLTRSGARRATRWAVVLTPARFGRRGAALRRSVGWARELVLLRSRLFGTVRAQWPRLSFGVVGYVVLQFALFAACLHLSAPGVAASVVVAAFALDRLMSLVPITPAGTGLAEAGAVSVLVTAGVPAAAALAGVLLYRAFVVALEIPVGGVVLAGWVVVRRRAAQRIGEPS